MLVLELPYYHVVIYLLFYTSAYGTNCIHVCFAVPKITCRVDATRARITNFEGYPFQGHFKKTA